LCETLVVGVISSEAIEKAKGPPIMTDVERIALVKNCKWVDEVCEGCAYDPTIEHIDKLNCSHVGHGDDLVQTSDGKDAYYPFKAAGRMKYLMFLLD
jgi:ethanolamine-phosphate cytidylyltransferase